MSDYAGSERFADDSPFGPIKGKTQKQADGGKSQDDKSLQDNDLHIGKITIKRAPRLNE